MLTFQASIPELRVIFPEHHKELGLLRGLMPLDPDYAEYVKREREGRLFMVTGRYDGRIAAYYVAQIAPGFHYKSTLTGHMDICYVRQEFRDRGLALPLFRAMERELRRRGVQVFYSGFKTLNPMGMDRLHELLGFEPADTYRIRWLGGPR